MNFENDKIISVCTRLWIFFLIFIFGFVFELNAQVNIQISAGILKDKNLVTTIPRSTISINNLYTFSFKRITNETLALLCYGEKIPVFELGMYYTFEHKNGIYFSEDKTNYYSRDILGLKLKFPNNVYIYTGTGLLKSGLFSTTLMSHLRKEFGIGYQLSDLHLTIDASFSNVVGTTFNIGYVIPVRHDIRN